MTTQDRAVKAMKDAVKRAEAAMQEMQQIIALQHGEIVRLRRQVDVLLGHDPE